MKVSSLQAARRIATDQEHPVFVTLQRTAYALREGSVDTNFVSPLLDETRTAFATLRAELDELLTAGRGELVARCVELYSDAHEAAAARLPLPWALWSGWRDDILSVSSHAAAAQNVSLQKASQEMSARYQALFTESFWGCQRALPVLTNRCLAISAACAEKVQNSEDDTSESNGSDEDGEDKETKGLPRAEAALTRLLEPAVHAWAALCYVAEHLDAAYASIGIAERTWLSEEVMNEKNDVVVEALIRQTFRRDIAVPSTALSLIWSDYEAFEVDERKRHSMSKAFQTSMNSEWMRGVKKVNACVTQPSSPDTAVVLTEQGNSEADALVRSWGTSSARAAIRSLAFTMQRLIEWEAFPGVLNPSRLEFTLHLLRSWVSAYTKAEHRWSPTDPFTAKDDSDLWGFVLERHTALLRWALLTVAPKKESSASVLAVRQAGFEHQIDALHCAAVSVLHCFEVYRQSTASSHATEDKKAARLRSVRRLTTQWLRDVAVRRFGAALLSDIQRGFEEVGDAAPESVDETVLLLEGALKQMLSEVQLFVPDAQDVDTVRDRLEPLIADLLETSALRSLALRRLALRLVRLFASTLEARSAVAQQHGDTADIADEKRVWTKCTRWYRQLLRATTEPPDVARDGLSAFVTNLVDAWTTVCRQGSYLFGRMDAAFHSGIQDVVYERRRALKRLDL